MCCRNERRCWCFFQHPPVNHSHILPRLGTHTWHQFCIVIHDEFSSLGSGTTNAKLANPVDFCTPTVAVLNFPGAQPWYHPWCGARAHETNGTKVDQIHRQIPQPCGKPTGLPTEDSTWWWTTHESCWWVSSAQLCLWTLPPQKSQL